MKKWFEKITKKNITPPKNRKCDIYFNYYINTRLNWNNLYQYFFNKPFSIYEVNLYWKLDKIKFVDKLIEKYAVKNKYIIRNDYAYDREKNKHHKVTDYKLYVAFVILKYGLAVWIDNDGIIILYDYKISKSEVLEIAAMTDEYKIPEEIPLKEFYLISRSSSFELNSYSVKPNNIDIENNYNDDFKNIHEIITRSLNKENKNGIILLHGIYGAGKTYYIRHLINSINKRFIYLPQNMISYLTDPEFLPFISRQQNSVLIIEDCENILVHRENGNSNPSAISSLLNLGDGLLSDALSINIICSFNTNIQKIDDALLRKGRVIARYEFKELEIKKAQLLADKLGKNITIEKPMALADVFNAESLRFENEKVSKIGFVFH